MSSKSEGLRARRTEIQATDAVLTERKSQKKKKSMAKTAVKTAGASVPLLILCYALFMSHRWYKIMYPQMETEDSHGRPLQMFHNVVSDGDNLVCRMYLTAKKQIDPSLPGIWEFPFTYSWDDERAVGQKIEHQVVMTQDHFKRSGNLYLTAIVFEPSSGSILSHAQSSVIKYQKPLKTEVTYKMATGAICPVESEPVNREGKVARGVPQMQIKLVHDTTEYNSMYHRSNFKPFMMVDEFWLTNDQLVKLNSTGVNNFNLSIHFDLMGIGRWRFQKTMERSLSQNAEIFGENSEEMLQMRDLFANTNPTLLMVTMFVTVLHMIFEYLAFKNDVSFWQETDPEVLSKHVSVRSVLIGIGCQIVVLLYLWDQSANFLVLASDAISIIIDCWKVKRVMQWEVTWLFNTIPCLVWRQRFGSQADQQNDAKATWYVCMAVAPMCIGYGFYSFFTQCHKGWYSFILETAASLVYGLGFALMTPQLFINYQLKSVAYLPWKRFVYRAINTFIDDLFSFIIRMPTMHRVSCFRDDVVFLVYLYQRHIYKVDKSRSLDGDPCAEAEEEVNKHKAALKSAKKDE